jgi:hypothetical protein
LFAAENSVPRFHQLAGSMTTIPLACRSSSAEIFDIESTVVSGRRRARPPNALETDLLLVGVLGLRLVLLLNRRTCLLGHDQWLRRFDCISQKKVFVGAFFEPLCFRRVSGSGSFSEKAMSKVPISTHKIVRRCGY